MKRTIVTFTFTLFLIVCNAQNPLPALKAYQYYTDNNRIDLGKEFENKFDPVVFTNVFFKYYKNPLYNHTFSMNKIMLFRPQYEYLLQTIVKNEDELSFQFRFNRDDDKISKIKLSYIRQKKSKMAEKKISKKDFETIITKDLITIKLFKSMLVKNDVLKIFLSLESADINLKDLSSINKVDSADYYVSLNIPEVINYIIDYTHIDLIEKEEARMGLIKFSYDITRLTENKLITSTTFKWKVKKGSVDANILFPLNTINLPLDIGTSASEIINKGK